ncbi:MAG: glycosyltransferase [Elusimicrobia bacterium]|nr:glycosyltransferase [Elusimicrobiota bacterium]
MKRFEPLVSIIIPAYNASDYLAQAIDSALGQTYKNIEIIIVNDGSVDGGKTEAVAKSYGSKIRYFRKPNGGTGSALNVAIRQMRGEFFSWLSHDDLYYPGKIERQIATYEELGRSDVILYCDFDLIDQNGSLLYTVRIPETPPHFFRYRLTLTAYLHGCSLLIPITAFDKCGLFDERLRTTQDYDLWFKMSFHYKFTQLRETLIKGRIHEGQGTRMLTEHVQREGDDLFRRFMENIPPAELKVASGQSLPGAYLKFAFNFRRRGFYRASNQGFKLALLAALGRTTPR